MYSNYFCYLPLRSKKYIKFETITKICYKYRYLIGHYIYKIFPDMKIPHSFMWNIYEYISLHYKIKLCNDSLSCRRKEMLVPASKEHSAPSCNLVNLGANMIAWSGLKSYKVSTRQLHQHELQPENGEMSIQRGKKGEKAMHLKGRQREKKDTIKGMVYYHSCMFIIILVK